MSLHPEWRDRLPEQLPAVPRSHFQSHHGEALARAYGQRPECLCLVDDGGAVRATWLLHATPGDYLDPPSGWLGARLDVYLSALHGPLIDPEVDRADAVHKLVRAVVRRVQKLRPIGGTLVLDPLIDDDERELWRAAAGAAGLGVEPTWTYAAQVRPTEEEMLAAIKAERRKAARKAAREGVTLDHRRDLDGFREYYDVRAQTRTRNDLPPVPWSHFEQTHAALAGSDVYHVFLARSGDRIGAGQIAFAYGGYVFLSGVSVADWALAEKSPANDFLQWQVLAWAVETGQDVVDFSGADPNSTDPKVQGIDRFKSRWGTELHESLRLEVPGSRLRARAARLAARVGR